MSEYYSLKEPLFSEINEEIRRAESLRDAGKFTRTPRIMGDADALLVIIEEFGEMVDDFLDGRPFRKEAVEVIACLVQMLQRSGAYEFSNLYKYPRGIFERISKAGKVAKMTIDAHEDWLKEQAIPPMARPKDENT